MFFLWCVIFPSLSITITMQSTKSIMHHFEINGLFILKTRIVIIWNGGQCLMINNILFLSFIEHNICIRRYLLEFIASISVVFLKYNFTSQWVPFILLRLYTCSLHGLRSMAILFYGTRVVIVINYKQANELYEFNVQFNYLNYSTRHVVHF